MKTKLEGEEVEKWKNETEVRGYEKGAGGGEGERQHGSGGGERWRLTKEKTRGGDRKKAWLEALTERGKRSASKKAQRHDEREKLEIRRSDCRGKKKEMENEPEEKKSSN